MNQRPASTQHPTVFTGAHYKKAITKRGVYISQLLIQNILKPWLKYTPALIHVGFLREVFASPPYTFGELPRPMNQRPTSTQHPTMFISAR